MFAKADFKVDEKKSVRVFGLELSRHWGIGLVKTLTGQMEPKYVLNVFRTPVQIHVKTIKVSKNWALASFIHVPSLK